MRRGVARSGWRAVVVCVVGGLLAGAPATTAAGSAPAPPSTEHGAADKFTCEFNDATEALTGAYGSASAIGWEGNYQGVVTCLGGSFYVQSGIEKSFDFGIYAGGPTTWVDADGYLPAQITTFKNFGANVTITEFADQLMLGGHSYVAVYCRIAIVNPTNQVIVADPGAPKGLIPLRAAPASVGPHATAVHDYVLAVDRFGKSYPWPPAGALAGAGGFDQHFAHMRAFWNAQLSRIASVNVPDRQLDDAYRSGFIYTQIARSGVDLDTGVNNYQSEFSHDVIGILANLFTQGDFEDAHALLIEARAVVGAQGQYEDGLWTYSWPWALYLLRTGDRAFVKANFSTPGPDGAGAEPSIKDAAHQIARDRTGPNGIMGRTDDIDSDGLWTVDDYEALMGLAAYRYLAHEVGDGGQERWATNEYHSLLAAMNRTLAATIRRFGLDYLPCSMIQPNSANRCNNPKDANWAAPFLSGRWAWDAQLFGVPVSGPGVQMIDATYRYGFGRLAGKLPPDTFGGYPGDYYSSGYNAGYGSGGLASTQYRDQGILSYEFMVSHTQSGPYSWWESASAPPASSPWSGSHPASGQGSSPHAWGIANANKVLLDSLVAEATDGTLIVGRGVPNQWLVAGASLTVARFPTTNGKTIGVAIASGGRTVTLTLSGSPANGPVLFQLPLFVDNIASTSAGSIIETTGTVQLSASQRTVTVRLQHAAA